MRWRQGLVEALDLALPATCAGCGRSGVGWCRVCRAEVASAWGAARRVAPRPAPVGFPATWAVAPYAGPLRHALAAYKDDGRRDLAAPLGAELGRAVAAALTDLAEGAPTGEVWLVPVPSSPQARRRRGDAPLEALAHRSVAVLAGDGDRNLPGAASPGAVTPTVAAGGGALRAGETRSAASPRLRCAPQLLRVRRRLADQAGLTVRDRAINLAGAHAADPAVRGRAVIVVDDVVTSGATLTEASRALRAAGAVHVTGACLAATARWGGRLEM